MFIPIKYSKRKYPPEIIPKIEELAGHFDKTEIKPNDEMDYSLHTEYAFGKRKLENAFLNHFDLCKEIYERHKDAIDKIISYKPDHIKIIEKELLRLLENSWKSHSTKNACYIFKEEWHKDFFEFFSQQVPFYFYLIYSYTKESLCIDIDLYLDEKKEKGGLFGLRDKFTEILDGEIKANRPENFLYLKKNKAIKFKKMTIENGYDSEDDLINVALEMKNLIDETITPLENTIKIFKEKYNDEIIEWKEKLEV